MKDEIIIRTILDTEIDILEGFLNKDRKQTLTDSSLYVSISDIDQLKGHLGTLKKLRETSWRAIKMDEVHNKTTVTMSNGEKVEWSVPKYFAGIPGRDDDPCPIPDMPQINWQTNTDQRTCCATVLKTENYPGQFEKLVKERDNWREMYDQELKKNEELGHRLTLANYDRDMKVEKLKKENEELKTKLSLNEEMLSNRYSQIASLKKENEELKKNAKIADDNFFAVVRDLNKSRDKVTELENRVINIKNENSELSRINAARLGDINRLQDKVDKLEKDKADLNGYLNKLDNAYKTHVNDKFKEMTFSNNIEYLSFPAFEQAASDILWNWKHLKRVDKS